MILNTTTVPSTSEKPVVMSGQNNKFDDINVLDMKKLYYWWEFVFEFYWGLNLVIHISGSAHYTFATIILYMIEKDDEKFA